MKYFLVPFFLIASLSADQINKKTLACPNMDALKKAPVESAASDPMDLSLFAIANGCEILTRRAGVETIGYDPRNSTELYVKILYKKMGTHLYVKRSAITIEQGGKKSSYRF